MKTGKVTSIGDGGHAFTVQLTGNAPESHSMDFVVDRNTHVEGQVTEGTDVTVEYVNSGGQLLAVTVTAKT